jgi:O-antigen/teichoic acid export membrane protein
MDETTPNQSSESDNNIILTAKGGGISFAGKMFVYLFRFLFGIILARVLGAELLGLYTLTLTITDIIAVLSLLGLGAGLVRYIPIAINQKDDARLWGIIQIGVIIPFLISVVLAFGLFIFADLVANGLFHRPDMAQLLRVASVGIPLFALMSELSSVTQAFKRMEFEVYSVDIAFNLSKLVLSALFLVLGLSVVGVLIAHNIGLAIAVGMLFYFVHLLFPIRRPVNQARRDFKELFRFSLPVYLTRVMSRFSGSLEAMILGLLGLMSGIGIFTTAMRLSGIGGLFHRSLQKIVMPMISDLYSRQEMEQLKRIYRTTTKWGMSFNLPIFLTIVFFAVPLLSIFGEEFIEGTTGLIILAFGTLFNASTGVCGSMITMTGHSKLTFLNSIVNIMMNLILDILFIPRWGIAGAALAITLTKVAINTLRTIEVYLLLRIFPYDWTFLKPLAAALLASGIVYGALILFGSNQTVFEAIIGTVLLWGTYLTAIYMLRLSDEDRLILYRVKELFSFGRK